MIYHVWLKQCLSLFHGVIENDGGTLQRAFHQLLGWCAAPSVDQLVASGFTVGFVEDTSPTN